MPAESQDQQEFMGAELRRKREGLPTKTNMSEAQLKEFASTKRKGLPKRVSGAARDAAHKIAAARTSRRRGAPAASRSVQATNAGFMKKRPQVALPAMNEEMD